MIYFDANFFIFGLLDNTHKGDKAKEIQKEIIAGKLTAFTSVLALNELI